MECSELSEPQAIEVNVIGVLSPVRSMWRKMEHVMPRIVTAHVLAQPRFGTGPTPSLSVTN